MRQRALTTMTNRRCRGRRAAVGDALRIGLLLSAVAVASARGQWHQFAGGPDRRADAGIGPENVSARLWFAEQDAGGAALAPEGASGPVVFAGRVFVNARHLVGGAYTANKLVAFDQATGGVLFERVVDKGVLDSWSSPAVDAPRGLVLLASGSRLFAFDVLSGAPAFVTPLLKPVVNASPAAAEDLPHGRAFITDYDPYGGDGRLYCINTSAFDGVANPYQPGEIVWSEIIGGTSGSTPGYAGGVAVVASAASVFGYPDPGSIYAFDVSAAPSNRLRWVYHAWEGFFGGVAVASDHVYAATYDFAGSGDNATLFKLRASDGALRWSVPCERTASIPIVAGDRVYLSAGLPGFGSTPKVQCFGDLGGSAVRLWDTHVDSGGQLVVGGWTHQPARVGQTLYVGRMPTGGGSFVAYTDLLLLDLSRSPGDPTFVRQSRSGAGSSPAIADGRLYSIGPGGLNALAARGDYSADGALRGDDLQGFCRTLMTPPANGGAAALGDFNADGAVDAADAALLRDRLLGR